MLDSLEEARARLAASVRAIARALRKRSYYRATFNTPAGEHVLADLMHFCRANRTTITVSPKSGIIDTHAMAVAEGRREVWLRVQNHLNLDEAKLKTLKENLDE